MTNNQFLTKILNNSYNFFFKKFNNISLDKKEDKGEVNVPLSIDGVDIQPGQYLYADLNGVIISEKALL